MLQNITHIVSHGVHLATSGPFTVLQDYLIISTVDTYEPYTFEYPNSLLSIPIAHINWYTTILFLVVSVAGQIWQTVVKTFLRPIGSRPNCIWWPTVLL